MEFDLIRKCIHVYEMQILMNAAVNLGYIKAGENPCSFNTSENMSVVVFCGATLCSLKSDVTQISTADS